MGSRDRHLSTGPPLSELRALIDGRAEGLDPFTIACSLVEAVTRSARWDLPADLRAAQGPVDDVLATIQIPDSWCSPAVLGALYEATLTSPARKDGAHFTPSTVAAGVTGLLGPLVGPDLSGATVWDPACGGGAFLLAAADALARVGESPERVVGELLWGTDLDPGAVAVAEVALWRWAHERGVPGVVPGDQFTTADSLVEPRPGPVGGFDVVVGNPPFQSQLMGPGVRSAERRAALAQRWGKAVGAYTDTAALFLAAGVEALAPGGRLSMVLPTSLLSGSSSARVRMLVDELAELNGLWVAGEWLFEATVNVWAPVLVKRDRQAVEPLSDVTLWRGATFEQVQSPPARPRLQASGLGAQSGKDSSGSASAWSLAALPILGVPVPRYRSDGRLADMAVATAGFRDEYYGLIDHVVESECDHIDELPLHMAPLITTGLIDPGRCWWADRPARFNRRQWKAPAVDLAALERSGGRAAAWVRATSKPKVVVATQTRVGEAAVDGSGRWVASTPTVVVTADPDRLWEVAAVICSPVGSAYAVAASAGTGRSLASVRPTSTSVLDLPLPVDTLAWRQGASALQAGERESFVTAMAEAYGQMTTTDLHAWWSATTPMGKQPR